MSNDNKNYNFLTGDISGSEDIKIIENTMLRTEQVTEPVLISENLILADIIDVKEIQSLMDNFYNLTNIPTAIIDVNGQVLIGVGWQKICTEFHRKHPETCKNCLESDTILAKDIPEGEFRIYKCKNGMWDLATPIVVGGKHLGNVFMGQFFFDYEELDIEYFRLKAENFGFNETEYLSALKKVPRLDRNYVDFAKAFFINLANSISRLSYTNIKLTSLLKERDSLVESLKHSEKRFRNMFEKPKAIMLLIEPETGQIIDANGAASKFYGWTRNELCSMKIQDLNMLSELEVHNERRAALEEKRNYFIFTHRLADGSTRTVEVYSSPIEIEGKEMLFSVIHDISNRKIFEENLRKSEKNTRAILDATQESIFLFDRQGKIVTANATAAARLNFQLSDIIGHNLSEFVSPEIFSYRLGYINQVFETGQPVQFEDEHLGIIFSHNLFPVFENDNVVNVVTYNQDITLKRNIEKLVEHLASFPKTNPEPILEIDLNGRITFFNEAALNILTSLNAGEDVNTFLPADMDEIRRSVKGLQNDKKFFREINVLGKTFYESIYFIKQLGVFRLYASDITEKKKNESQIRKLYSAVEHSPDSIVVTDSKGLIEYVNPKFSEITGYLPEEVVGKTPGILKSGRTKPETYKDLWKTILSGKQWYGSLQNKKKNGELYWESVSIAPVFDVEGSIVNFVAVKEDITAQKKREDQLFKFNRTLIALQHSGDALLRASNETNYINEVCKIIIEDCGYALVWIGLAESDEKKSVIPVAFAGFDEGYIAALNVKWSDTDQGNGPTGTAIRTGEPVFCRNMHTDENFVPWKTEAEKRGYASSVAIPLKENGKSFGALTIYSKEPESFLEEEIELLSELAENLAYGITIIRLRQAHALAEKELKKHHDKLELLVAERTNQLQLANQILKEAQSVAHMGHWQLDLKNNYLQWSDEVFKIFRIEPGSFDATLDAFLNFVHPEDRKFVAASYQDSVANKTLYNIDHKIILPGGEIRTVHEQCVTHYDNEGEPLYSLGIIQDITEFIKTQTELEIYKNQLEELVKTRTKELALANEKLKFEIEKEKQVELLLKESLEKEKELNEMKSRFISTTSHEFRTPLTSILSSMQLIQRYRKKLSDDQIEELFDKTKNSISYLTKLLDDILTISHADSGRILFNPEMVDLYELCINIIEEVKHKASEKHHFVFSYLSRKKEYFVDVKLFRFIIMNLLSNAFKYSPKGKRVLLEVKSDKKNIRIMVSDEGIGIPKEDMPHLFKPFHRSANTGEIEGTGLGLSIVQRAVELHKGIIKCYSKINNGTKFIVKIPLGLNNEQKNTGN